MTGIPVLFIPGNAGSYKQGKIIQVSNTTVPHNYLLWFNHMRLLGSFSGK